jgi:hypothetical protein
MNGIDAQPEELHEKIRVSHSALRFVESIRYFRLVLGNLQIN